MRNTLSVKNARENNLKNVCVDIPREKLVVVTGLSGSGKSSLAFETIYAEGQRRFLESLSAWSKRFVTQLKKPDVDFIYGLSPVISIEQKSVSKNPRSTVGTMTDIYDYLRILFSTVGVSHCPYCAREIPIKLPYQMAEHILSLPEGSVVEICAPVSRVYGEDYSYVLAEVRTKGYRRMRIDGELMDISEDIDLDEGREYVMEAVIDKFVVKKGLDKNLLTSIDHGLRVGERYLRLRILTPEKIGNRVDDYFAGFACPEHHIVMGELHPFYFSFNETESACVTCMGLGTYLKVHPDLLVPDKSRSIKGGAFVDEALKYDKNLWGGRMMYSLAQHYGFDLDAPFRCLPPEIVDILFYGTQGEKFPLVIPEGARVGDEHAGKLFRFNGIITDIERRYRHFRKQEVANSGMDTYLKKVMVEHICPDCNGKKLKPQRLKVTIDGKNADDVQRMNISELREFLGRQESFPRNQEAGEQINREITGRLDLLLGIGLDYLSLGRRAGTLSGGESQRIRLSTQIGSGLMGMLYVLDEPSIGLHPKDNVKMIATLRQLRDIGNSVIVVEHDEETMRAADHIVEIGPGPGVHGGEIVAQGTIQQILRNPKSLTGQYLTGKKRIPMPEQRREGNGKFLSIFGARENNLRSIDVEIPLGKFIAVTGASGSGKSTLIHQILYKRLVNVLHDSRVLSGAHDAITGIENLSDIINIDQTPIGRSPRSNPATYIGFYDEIRRLFAAQPESQARGYTASRFSFNVKGGRCEECAGEGMIVTQLHFMPEVENSCPACKGARFNQDTLEIIYKSRNIAEALNTPVEDGVEFFADIPLVAHKLRMLNDLGLGYLTLGQASTTLSGGEAQRIKLADELSKIKRGRHNFYILDEPTTGLHLADIQRLLDSLNRLVDAGHTVLVIEHHLDVIKTADWVIDLGPEGGHNGGEVIACGTPEQVAAEPRSHTGRFLRPLLP